MEYTEKAIQLALENGFEPKDYKVFSGIKKNLFDIHRGELRICSDFGEYVESLTYRDVTSRPEFWRALGKGLGWKHFHGEFCECHGFVWLERWHSFIDHLASGGEIEDYFKKVSH